MIPNINKLATVSKTKSKTMKQVKTTSRKDPQVKVSKGTTVGARAENRKVKKTPTSKLNRKITKAKTSKSKRRVKRKCL